MSLQESSLVAVVVPSQESGLVVSLQESSLAAVPLQSSSLVVGLPQEVVGSLQSGGIVVDGVSHNTVVAEIAEDERVLRDDLFIAIFLFYCLLEDLVAEVDKRLWATDDRVVWSPMVSVIMAAMAAFGSV